MNKKVLLALVAGIVMLAACKKDNVGTGFTSKETVTATLPAPQTKTTLSGLQVVWGADDAISVFAQDGSNITNNEGTIATGQGTTEATFDVVIEGTQKLAALYPYAVSSAYDGDKMSINMADTYAYTENGIGGAPMASLIKSTSKSTAITFKNAGALMGITVNNIPAGYNKAILTSKGDEVVAGPCEITFDADGNPTMVATSAATGKVITITFDAASELTNKTFYFPIPVDDYSSLQISISNGSDTKVLKTKALSAKRSVRYKSTLTLDAVTGVIPTEVTGSAAANDALEDGKTSLSVTVAPEETTPTITLPQGTAPTTLAFEPIPQGAVVTIQEGTEGNVTDELTIAASSEPTSNNIFEIILPNSTVTLESNGEGTVYDEVTAHTAANTLVVGADVTINTLKVKGGNVRVSGTISNISRTDDNADALTCIFLEDGASIPANLGEGFVVIEDNSKWDGKSYYAPKYDETSKTYTVKDAYELAWIAVQVNEGKDYFTGKQIVLANDIDLNNKEWAPIGTAVKDHGFCGNFDGGNNTIKNLKITQVTPDADGYAYIGLFGITEENTIENLVIENVNISSTGDIVSAAIAYPYYTVVKNITVKGDIKIEGRNYVSGVLAYTRRCYEASGLTIAGNSGSTITGSQTVGGVISDIQMNGGGIAKYSNFKASGLTLTATDKMVGGISGIIASQTLDGATVENVTIVCDDARKGIVSGALGGKSTIKNISVKDVTGATDVVGATYDHALKVFVDGDVYVGEVMVNTAAELDKALANESVVSIVLGSDLTIANTIFITRSVAINGNGHSIMYEGAAGGRIMDVKKEYPDVDLKLTNITLLNNINNYIERGINYNTTGSLTLEDVIIKSKEGQVISYAINMPSSAKGAVVYIKNSSVTGNIALNIWGTDSEINVENSELYTYDTSDVEGYSVVKLNSDGINSAEGSVINITGGCVKTTYKNANDPMKSYAITNNTLTGEINVDNTTEVVGETRVTSVVVDYKNTDNFYSFTTLQAAINKAAENPSTVDELRLIRDLELAEAVIIPEGLSIVLNLNGYTISHSYECTGSYSMITNNGTLVIDGEGKISMTDTSAGGGDDWGSYTITNNGTLTVNNGTIEHLGSTDDWGVDRPTNIPIQNYQGKVTVNGGVISSPQFRSLRDFTAGGEIVINGGIFKGQVWMQGEGNGSSSLTINGGEFSPTQGYDGSSVFVTNGKNDILVSVTGGKFNTKIGCNAATKAGIKGAVKGGVFTEVAKTATSADLIAEGYAFSQNADGTYTVVKE